MRRSTPTIAVYFFIVFLSGLVVGAFGYRATFAPITVKAARPSPDEWRKQYISEMQTRLKLTSEESRHLNAILDETRIRFHDARIKHDQVMNGIKDEQKNEIRAMLTEQQRPEYEKLIAEREARAKAAGGPR